MYISLSDKILDCTTGSWNFPNELCVSFQVLNGLLNYIDTSDILILQTITQSGISYSKFPKEEEEEEFHSEHSTNLLI